MPAATRKRPLPMLKCSEKRECRALRVLQHSESSNFFRPNRADIEAGAELFGLRGGFLAIGHSEVRQPVRRGLRIGRPSGRDAADELLAIADVEISGLAGLEFPAEYVRIELGGASGVR